MRVQCPECNTKYNLDEQRLGPGGSKVRCTRCQHVFMAFKPGMPVDEPKAASQSTKSTITDSFEDELAAMFEHKKPAPAAKAPVDEKMLADLQGAFQQPLIESTGKHDGLDEDQQPQKNKSGKVWSVLFVLLALLLAAGAGIYFLKPSLIGLPTPDPTAPVQPEAPTKEGVAQIALENVRQYFVPNDKEGQLFIIEGKAVNRFAEPRELIRLKASLFDKQGVEVAAQEFMCGNVVSLYQLQVSTRQDIEAALAAKVGILTNNTNVQPGSSVPFMVVFFKAPDSVEEFGLEVIQSSSPQK